MLNFDRIFHDVAKNESRALQVFDRPEVPTGMYVLREFYCNEPDCDCRRVILHVHSVEAKRVVASINYAFEPAKPPYQD
jgi:ribulose-5-phosphate 4-epimerase/fuculose-1-phosphate aldolase